MTEGTEVMFSTDGGATWQTLGTLAEPFNCTATEQVSRVAVDPFNISGTPEIEVRNYQLEDMALWPLRIVEPSPPYSPKGKPWLKRKKGRAAHGY